MKKKILCVCMAMGLIACSNYENEEVFAPVTKSATNLEFQEIMTNLESTDTLYIESLDDLYKDFIEKTTEYNSNYQYYTNPSIMPRTSVTDYTATGYDSQQILRSTKMMFSKNMAELIGNIKPSQIYIVQYINVIKNVQRTQNSTFINDENCTTVGWIPVADPKDHGWDVNPLGYSSMKLNENVQTLTSQCAKVAYTILGQELSGIYYPQRSPNNYKWTYSCLMR